MKLGARNQLEGRIGGGVIVTSSVTNEAVDDLALAVGDEAWAVVKAWSVIIAK